MKCPVMEDYGYDEGIDEYDGRSVCGGSDELTDDFDRQELEWALYSQIHHEGADDTNTQSKSWLEQECDISITEDGDTSRNSGQLESSTPKTTDGITRNDPLRSGKTCKMKKTKPVDEDSKKTSKETEKLRAKEKKRKSSNKDAVVNLEALLVPEPSKITPVNKTQSNPEDAEHSKHRRKQKLGDKGQKLKRNHKKEVSEEFIVVSSDNSDSDSSHNDCQTQNTAAEKGVCVSSDSESDYCFSEIQAEEATDIQLNVNNPKEFDNDTIFENKDVTVEDVHNSLGDGNWDLINADVWKTGTGRMRQRYYRSNAKCNNCNERGHLMKDCPEPKKQPACILCGLRGHVSRSCPESLCYNCNRPGHASRDCAEPRRSRTVECRRCYTRGHIATECPDIWRQFHITTEPGPMCKGSQKENKRRFCFNCAKKGHWAYECRDAMMDSWKLPVTPFVAHYEVKAAYVTGKHAKKRQSDSLHENPAKHTKPTHTPTKETSHTTREQSQQPTPYAKKIISKTTSTGKSSRVKRLMDSLYSEDFPRTPLEEYVGDTEDLAPRKKPTNKQENKRKWKAWQKKRKTEERERKLSQLQQYTGYEDEHDAPPGGACCRGDRHSRRGGGVRRSYEESGEGSLGGDGRKRSRSSRRGKGGGGNERRHSDGPKYGSQYDAWDPADYRDPWDTAGHGGTQHSEGSRRNSDKKYLHVTQRGFRMSRH